MSILPNYHFFRRLSLFSYIKPLIRIDKVDLSKIIQVLFEEENFMLMGSEIRSLIIKKRIDLEDIIRNSYRVSGYDDATSVIDELLGQQGTGRNARLETILLESGIIGGVNDIRPLPPNNEIFGNKDEMCLIIGDYGKDFGHTRIMSGTQYVLHPLCFELFGCLYDKRVKVIQSNSGEEDWLNLIIR